MYAPKKLCVRHVQGKNYKKLKKNKGYMKKEYMKRIN